PIRRSTAGRRERQTGDATASGSRRSLVRDPWIRGSRRGARVSRVDRGARGGGSARGQRSGLLQLEVQLAQLHRGHLQPPGELLQLLQQLGTMGGVGAQLVDGRDQVDDL
ncbi:MAG: hypothetical protein ACK55I_04205, partial [bacterium]